MTAEKARVATGNKVVDLTRYIMARDGLTQDLAYAKLYRMELFKLLSDPETRLFLEDDAYLQKAYEAEFVSGVEALYDFIKPEP